MNRDTFVLYCWGEISTFQVVTATHPSSQHHWRRSLPNMSVLKTLIFWMGNPQSGEIFIAIKRSSTAGSLIVPHWGPESEILSPPEAKHCVMPQNFPSEERKLPQRWMGFELQAEFLSQAWWMPSKWSRKTLALCTENCFAGGVEGSCSCHGGEVGMFFSFLFLLILFPPHLLWKQVTSGANTNINKASK